MRLEEKTLTIPKYPNVFVYFLVDEDDDVVYVGKTTKGIIRPLSQKTSKIFDSIKIIPCEEKDLDIMENILINKYKPKYNGQRNFKSTLTIKKLRDAIRERYGWEDFDISGVKKLLESSNIKFTKDLYSNSYVIDELDLKQIFEVLDKIIEDVEK